MIDLSAAFDTVAHAILLQRFETMFGLKDTVLKWFKSYLSGRTQAVNTDGVHSKAYKLEFSVPPGTILGAPCYCKYTLPLGIIFRLYKLFYHMYADDSQLYKAVLPKEASDQQPSINQLVKCVRETSHWMEQNKLKMNESKTEFMVEAKKNQQSKNVINLITVGGDRIVESCSVRNLGV